MSVKQDKVVQEVAFHLADSLNTDSEATGYLDQVGLIPVGHHVHNLWPSTRPWCHETAGWLSQDIIDHILGVICLWKLLAWWAMWLRVKSCSNVHCLCKANISNQNLIIIYNMMVALTKRLYKVKWYNMTFIGHILQGVNLMCILVFSSHIGLIADHLVHHTSIGANILNFLVMVLINLLLSWLMMSWITKWTWPSLWYLSD